MDRQRAFVHYVASHNATDAAIRAGSRSENLGKPEVITRQRVLEEVWKLATDPDLAEMA